jgi:hypothetical protein
MVIPLILIGFYARLRNHEKRLLASSCLSLRQSACTSGFPTGVIFFKFDIGKYFLNLAEKVPIWLKFVTLLEDLSTFY